MQSCELVAAITSIACSISKCYAKEDLPLLAAIFSQLGDTLATISAQNDACSEDAE